MAGSKRVAILIAQKQSNNEKKIAMLKNLSPEERKAYLDAKEEKKRLEKKKEKERNLQEEDAHESGKLFHE